MAAVGEGARLGAVPALLATPSYLRLWFAGGVGNAMRWLELLVAGIFTYGATRSAFMVAAVTVARTLPMLFIGVFAGVIGEAWNRKTLLLIQLLVMATSSAALSLLAAFGRVEVWHIGFAGIVAGMVWACELAVRRRMIAEVVAAPLIAPAVAFDSLTGSTARVIGPLAGGALYDLLGIAGAYLLAAVLYFVAAIVAAGLEFHQETRRLRLSRVIGDIAEGIAAARGNPAIMAVIFVSIIANAFGFSYSALIAPIGLDLFGVSPTLVGALAAADPLGAILSGIVLSLGWFRLDGWRALLHGTLLFFVGIIAFALSPWFGLAFVLLLIGGLGTAAFSIMQTTLVLTEAPPALRSRVMGIVTVCIGTGPIGVLAIGLLSEAFGPSAAILVMADCGLIGLIAVWLWLAQAARAKPGRLLE